MMKYGFIDFCGNAWCHQHVDSYNNYTMSVNAQKGGPAGSVAQKAREFALNQRHQFFVQILDIYKERNGHAKFARHCDRAIFAWASIFVAFEKTMVFAWLVISNVVVLC